VAVSVYLDASVLVALFTTDPHSVRADSFLQSYVVMPIVSDFASAEFASAVARRVRTRDLTRSEARAAFLSFDAWTAQATRRVQVGSGDVTTAEMFLRQLDLTLQTPDALNLAITQRLEASLATFDKTMATCARILRIPVAAA
jgi:uncharacterized protein